MENFKKNGRKWEIKNNIPYKSEKFRGQQAKGPILVVLIKKVYNRCEVQEMRKLNYFFEIFYTICFYKNKSLGFGKKKIRIR